MPQLVAGVALGIGVALLVVSFAWVARAAVRPFSPIEVIAPSAYRARAIWAVLLVGAGVVAVVTSLPLLPYAPVRIARVMGSGPPRSVSVTGMQYGWVLSPDSGLLPEETVQFDVTSADVNHDFAMYDPHDRLVGQVQAMPGFTNSLVLTFERPGLYTIRCLELCGPLHQAMQRTVCVGSCGTS